MWNMKWKTSNSMLMCICAPVLRRSQNQEWYNVLQIIPPMFVTCHRMTSEEPTTKQGNFLYKGLRISIIKQASSEPDQAKQAPVTNLQFLPQNFKNWKQFMSYEKTIHGVRWEMYGCISPCIGVTADGKANENWQSTVFSSSEMKMGIMHDDVSC